MKKAAVFLLCFSMLFTGALAAYADDENVNNAPGNVRIETEVPDSHRFTVKVEGNVTFRLNGKEGTLFVVERLSEPELEIIPNEGERVTKVTINGEDMTDQFVDGKYKFPPVYQDEYIEVTVITEAIPTDTSEPDSSPDSDAPDQSKPDSSSSSSSSSKSDSKGGNSSSSPGGDSNPATGLLGGLSAGGLVILGTLTVVKRKEKSKSE